MPHQVKTKKSHRHMARRCATCGGNQAVRYNPKILPPCQSGRHDRHRVDHSFRTPMLTSVLPRYTLSSVLLCGYKGAIVPTNARLPQHNWQIRSRVLECGGNMSGMVPGRSKHGLNPQSSVPANRPISCLPLSLSWRAMDSDLREVSAYGNNDTVWFPHNPSAVILSKSKAALSENARSRLTGGCDLRCTSMTASDRPESLDVALKNRPESSNPRSRWADIS